jgi:hypothetical protein
MIDAHKNGQIIAWASLYSHMSRLLERNPDWQPESKLPTHVIDLTFMEPFEPKPGFHGYGGKAYLTLKDGKLTLDYLIAPKDVQQKKWLPDPKDATFRNLENRFMASSIFLNVAVFHLQEIHAITSIVNACMYNAFDISNKSAVHPFRAVLQMNFFNSVAVQELTTAHLMDRTGVFSQIFALKHSAICDLLNDCNHSYSFATDMDWKKRISVFAEIPEGSKELPWHLVPENSLLSWEKRYQSAYKKYATSIVNAFWKANDPELESFYKNLNEALPNGMPSRYNQFKTKEGVVCFYADVLHCVTVRHELYGTKVVQWALDHRYTGLGQVPCDQLPQPEEDYNSLIMVAIATSMKNFPKLMDKNSKIFEKLVAVLDEDIQKKFIRAFEELQKDLQEMETEWTSTSEEKLKNVNFQRILPSELEIGAGY